MLQTDFDDGEECPITLEPLNDLPYPPFALSSSTSEAKHYFDGAALAAYIISQGTFTNPLSREPLKYEDCVQLDEYLDQYVYTGGSHLQPNQISVREAWSLREAIKVKVAGGDGYDESQRRREEALRNEASVALRGLFVFGHERRRRINDSSSNQTTDSQSLPRAAGGFNLYHIPDAGLNHSWGLGSSSNQEGLRIIDDNEAAHEAADEAAWREVQEAFPLLSGEETVSLPTAPCDQNDNMPSQILATVRHTAKLTIEEERAKEEEREKARQRHFLEALERKRQRIEARRKAKRDTTNALTSNKKAEAVKQSAREEIDRWINQKWNEWETDNLELEKTKQKTSTAISTADEPRKIDNTQKNNSSTQKENNSELSAEEKAAKAAAKKKAKRQKAKERAKEKKQIEKIEQEKKERALALQKEKESSSVRCDACRGGILGCGFDKFGKKFCSTKCARSVSK